MFEYREKPSPEERQATAAERAVRVGSLTLLVMIIGIVVGKVECPSGGVPQGLSLQPGAPEEKPHPGGDAPQVLPKADTDEAEPLPEQGGSSRWRTSSEPGESVASAEEIAPPTGGPDAATLPTSRPKTEHPPNTLSDNAVPPDAQPVPPGKPSQPSADAEPLTSDPKPLPRAPFGSIPIGDVVRDWELLLNKNPRDDALKKLHGNYSKSSRIYYKGDRFTRIVEYETENALKPVPYWETIVRCHDVLYGDVYVIESQTSRREVAKPGATTSIGRFQEFYPLPRDSSDPQFRIVRGMRLYRGCPVPGFRFFRYELYLVPDSASPETRPVPADGASTGRQR